MADTLLKPAVLLNAGSNRPASSGVWATGFWIAAVLLLGGVTLAMGQQQSTPVPTPAPERSSVATPTAAASQPAELIRVDRPAVATPAKPSPRTLRMTVTAYCACPKCCGRNARGITASGKPVTHNGGRFVAADPRLLKLGTKLQIPGYHGAAVVPVIDTGGAIKGNRLDVFFPSHAAALQWGRQTLDVVVVE
jgi:3D (Asp-Asp-Asp) domain-containing protein